MSKVRWADMTDDDLPDPPSVVSKHGIKVTARHPAPSGYVPPHLRTSDKTKTPIDSSYK